MNGAVGLFGGTFDPVHFGHLRMALELRQLLGLESMRLIPASLPPHREAPGSNAQHRLAMLRLAAADEPSFQVDDRELRREGPSYTFDTLASLRAELGGGRPLVWAMGADAFAQLHTWHRWRELLTLGSIVVLARPGAAIPSVGPVADLLRGHICASHEELLEHPSGRVALVNLTPLDISATQIRRLIGRGLSPRYLLPEAVWQYIQEHQLYGAANTPAGAV